MVRISGAVGENGECQSVEVVVEIGQEQDLGISCGDDREDGVDLRVLSAQIAQQQPGAVAAQRSGKGGDAECLGGSGSGRQRDDQAKTIPSAMAFL